MDWTWIIYGVAALLALRSLFSLMTAYRQRYLSELFETEVRRRERELEAELAIEAQQKADFGRRKSLKRG